MSYRGGQTEESNPTEVQIQFKKKGEVVNNKSEYLPWADNLKYAIESTDGDAKEYIDVFPRCIMRSRGGQAK